MARRRWTALAVAGVFGLAACAPGPVVPPLVAEPGQGTVHSSPPDGEPSPVERSASPTTEGATEGPSEPVALECRDKAESLTSQERAGQLLMVGVSTGGLDTSTESLIRRSKAGSVVLLGTGSMSTDRTVQLAAAVGSLGSADLPMLVAADQEGGQVQRLRGPGFTTIPPAVEQGELSPSELREQSETWGGELRGAGVRFNLAPTADVVPEEKVSTNAPIGRLQRHYSSDPATASAAVEAFVDGMAEAGVATSLKHFPGLGEVEENTDFSAATDTDTVEGDENWEPFIKGIEAGASSVMISSAVFQQIDPDNEAVFSRRIITEILRGDLGFDGVVIADDLGAAVSVKGTPPGDRAVLFLRAGGDLVINADPKLAPEMADAIVAAIDADDAFADQVTDSVARVLALKQSVGVGTCD